MATPKPSVQLNGEGNFVCVPCGCSNASGRAQAGIQSSSELGANSLQYTSLTILSSDINRGSKGPSFHPSAVSISNVGKSARPATRKATERPTPRSHLPQRTAAAAATATTSSARDRAPKASSSIPRAATTSSAKQPTATRKPIEKPGPSRSSLPPRRTAAAAAATTSSVKERASKTSSSMARAAAATSSAKQVATTRINPIEKPSPSRSRPLQRTAAPAASSVKERALKASSSKPSQRTAARATSSVVKDSRAPKTSSSSMPRAATSAAKQVSATPTLRTGRTTTRAPSYARTSKSPGSVVSKRKETPGKAAPRKVQKQPAVTGEKNEKEVSVWVDKQELVSASYIEVHDLSEVDNDPVSEIPEPIDPPGHASQLTSNVEGNDGDQDDIDVPRSYEQVVVPSSSMEGHDPVQHQPSSSPEQAASPLSSGNESNDRDRDDIDVRNREHEVVSTSTTEGSCPHDEPRDFFSSANHDEPEVHEQHEPLSPPQQASQLTYDRDDIDVPKDDNEPSEASKEKPVAGIVNEERRGAEKEKAATEKSVAGIINDEQREAEKDDVPKDEPLQDSKEKKPVAGIVNKEQRHEAEKADAEENQKSAQLLGSPNVENVRAKREAHASNEVIEETRSKLLLNRKSKVKALVGAFETVISMQDSDEQN